MGSAYSSRTADKFVVRLPEGMRERIAVIARDNNRSMNSEIIDRLTLSIEQGEAGNLTIRTLAQVTRRCEDLEQQLAALKALHGNEATKTDQVQTPKLTIASSQ